MAKVLENIDLPVSDVHKGSILLLHDGGGDRSNTVKALPLIIAAFGSAAIRSFPYQS